MTKDNKIILWGVLAVALLVVFLRFSPFLGHTLSDSTLRALPEAAVAVVIEPIPGPIHRYMEEHNVEPLAISDDIPVIARAIVQIDSKYVQVGLAHADAVQDGVGEPWDDVVLVGGNEGIEMFTSSQPNDHHAVLPPDKFRQNGALLVRSSFLTQRNGDLIDHVNEGWVAFRFPTRLQTGIDGHHFELFLPTNEIIPDGGGKLPIPTSDDIRPIFVLQGIRADTVIPEELPKELAQLRTVSGMEADIREFQSVAAPYPLSFALIEHDDSLNFVLQFEIHPDDGEVLSEYMTDMIQKRASLQHASEENIYDQYGRRIAHLEPHSDPEEFIEQDTLLNGSILRLPCGLAEVYDKDGCDGNDLVVLDTKDALIISNSLPLLQKAHEQAGAEGKVSFEVFIDMVAIRQYMDTDAMNVIIRDVIGLDLSVADVNRVEVEGERVEGGTMLRGSLKK